MELLGSPQTGPTVICEENNVCIQLAQNAANTSRTKHVGLWTFCLKQLERLDIVGLICATSMDQHADFV